MFGITHLLAVFGFALLCAGWGLLQILARRMKTDPHFDHQRGGCGQCPSYQGEGRCESECLAASDPGSPLKQTGKE